MAEQLTGVLREVSGGGRRQPRPAFSSQFSPELQAVGAEAGAMEGGEWAAAADAPPTAGRSRAGLPVPQVDITDPAAGYLATLSTLDPAQLTAALSAAARGESGTPPAVAESAETRLALARALIVSGALDDAAGTLADLAGGDRADWRTTWYQGLHELAGGPARGGPGRVRRGLRRRFPGSSRPSWRWGSPREAAGDPAAAARYFGRVWTVDRSYVSAAFGLARARLAADDRAGRGRGAGRSAADVQSSRGGADHSDADSPHARLISPESVPATCGKRRGWTA